MHFNYSFNIYFNDFDINPFENWLAAIANDLASSIQNE
jgi:hypothetical protein